MRVSLIIACLVCVSLAGCLSAYHRSDFDKYEGASASWQGNGRDTAASQPTTQTVRQEVPGVGRVFIIHVHGRAYEAMRKSDGRIYIIQEVQ